MSLITSLNRPPCFINRQRSGSKRTTVTFRECERKFLLNLTWLTHKSRQRNLKLLRTRQTTTLKTYRIYWGAPKTSMFSANVHNSNHPTPGSGTTYPPGGLEAVCQLLAPICHSCLPCSPSLVWSGIVKTAKRKGKNLRCAKHIRTFVVWHSGLGCDTLFHSVASLSTRIDGNCFELKQYVTE